MRRVLAFMLVAALAGCGGDEEEAPAATPAVAGSPAIPPRLLESLREGGNVLVFRHATTESTTDEGGETVGDCETQRNLSEQGRQESREIGKIIKQVGIPIGDVLASPLCRTSETAEGLFGRVTEDPRLLSPGLEGTEADDRRRARQLRELADTPPSGDGNTAIVTHTGNIGAAFDNESVLEADALVFAPDGDGEPELVARIPADAWQTLAAP